MEAYIAITTMLRINANNVSEIKTLKIFIHK